MRFRRSGWLCNRLSLCEKDTFLHSELQWSWGEVSVFVLSCHSKFQLLLFVRQPGHYHQVGVKVKPIWQFALFRRKTECQNVTIRIWNNRPWNYACEQLARCGSHSRQLTCYKRLGATRTNFQQEPRLGRSAEWTASLQRDSKFHLLRRGPCERPLFGIKLQPTW